MGNNSEQETSPRGKPRSGRGRPASSRFADIILLNMMLLELNRQIATSGKFNVSPAAEVVAPIWNAGRKLVRRKSGRLRSNIANTYGPRS